MSRDLSKVKFNISVNQIDLLNKYKTGDVVVISSSAYVKLRRKFCKAVGVEDEITAKQLKEEGKLTRPIVILWNHPKSNFMIAAPLTSIDKGFLSFKVDETSFARTDIIKINKNTTEILSDGSIKTSVDEREVIDKYRAYLKGAQPKSYIYLLETENKCLKTVK